MNGRNGGATIEINDIDIAVTDTVAAQACCGVMGGGGWCGVV